MELVLSRRAGVPIRDQLRFQLELKILSGDLVPGQRLPSVRALARRLNVHANTVSAAYRDLAASGHVRLKRGAGVFASPGAPVLPQEARGLDEMIRLALYLAFRRGFSGAEVRTAVERWLAAAPPDRVVVVDPSPEMGELLVRELRDALGVPALRCGMVDVERDHGLLSGALALVLPHQVEAVARLHPSAALEAVTLELAAEARAALLALPPGAIVLVVSHSAAVLRFASVLLQSLRGHEILVEARELREGRDWRGLVAAADLVLADALCHEAVARTRPRRLREVRFVSKAALERVRDVLNVVVPRVGSGHREAPGRGPQAPSEPKAPASRRARRQG